MRFLFTELDSRDQLTNDCSMLWRLKRRLILTGGTSQADMEYYRRRMPERVDELAHLVADAAGLTAEQVFVHDHFRHAFSFARMAECWRADYIHTYFFYERTLFALVASYLLNIPRGVSCYADHMMNDYALKLIPLQMRSCDVVVATSARIKGELESLANHPLPQVVVKPNAIDIKQFPANERPAATGQECQIVTVSRVHPKKGLTYLMEAADLLRARGVNTVVRILGEPDHDDAASVAYYTALKESIVERNLQSVVILEGRKSSEEVRRYLFDSGIFAAPFVELPNGDKDGIPTALLEAMAAGCAVVSTDAGSMLEVINHDVEGLIVPQRDPAALADAIERLVKDAGLRARLAGAAKERVRAEFDIHKCEARFHQRVRGATGAATPKAARRMATA